MNKTIIKVIYYFLGTTILALGITLSLLSKLGAGAYDAMNSNLSSLIGISVGQAMYISVTILFIITMILKPKKIYIIGVILTGIISIDVDLLLKIIPPISYFPFRVLYFGFAVIFIPLGISFIIRSQLPLSPMENILMIITEKTKWSITVVKIILESSYALIAVIYGFLAGIGVGAILVGTIIITITVGPGMGIFMKLIKEI